MSGISSKLSTNILKAGYRSPSPSDSDDEDDQTEHGSKAPWRPPGMTREAKLARDLNFFDRYETVKFTETPFTLAQVAAGHRDKTTGGSSSYQDSGILTRRDNTDNAGWKVTGTGPKTSGKPGPSANNKAVKRQAGSSIQPANPDPGGKFDSTKVSKPTTAPKKRGAPKNVEDDDKPHPRKNDFGGWQVKGAPITLKKPSETKNKAKGGRKTKAQKEKEEKEKEEKEEEEKRAVPSKSTTSKRGKKEASKGEDKIVFSRIREFYQNLPPLLLLSIDGLAAGAEPSSRFPIVQGLHKQRELATKPTIKASPADVFPLDKDEDMESLPFEIDVDELIGDIGDQAEEEVKKNADKAKIDHQDAKPNRVTKFKSSDLKAFVYDPLPRKAPHKGRDLPAKEVNLEKHTPSVASVGAVEQGGERDDGELPSEDEEALDPVIKAQREKLQNFSQTLRRENAQYQRERRHKKGMWSSDIDESIPKQATIVSPTKTELVLRLEREVHARKMKEEEDGLSSDRQADRDTYSGTTRVPSTYTNPKVGFDTPTQREELQDPPTITHVSIPDHGTTSRYFDQSSSSGLPYSSPLGDKLSRDYIHQPSPLRYAETGFEHVEALEDLVDANGRDDQSEFGRAYQPWTDHGHLRHADIRQDRQGQRPGLEGHGRQAWRSNDLYPERGVHLRDERYPPVQRMSMVYKYFLRQGSPRLMTRPHCQLSETRPQPRHTSHQYKQCIQEAETRDDLPITCSKSRRISNMVYPQTDVTYSDSSQTTSSVDI